MHPIWDIPELVGLIFDFLTASEAAKATAVSHRFWSAALPRIWRDVNTFYKLMNLLPPDAITKIAYTNYILSLHLIRPLNESDWERFLLYTMYTKSLSVIIDRGTPGQYLELMQHLPRTPILPNLISTELKILKIDPKPDWKFLRLFVPPTVSKVRIRACGRAAERTIAQVLETLAEEIEIPNLKSLRITSLNAVGPYEGTGIPQVLTSHKGIQELELELLTSSQILGALGCAGPLPNLRHLNVRTMQMNGALEHPPLLLPELETLQITGSYPFIISILACIGPGNMRGVQIVVETDRSSSRVLVDAPLFQCLSYIGRFSGLKALEMEVKIDRIAVAMDDFACILPCTALETLRIVGSQLHSSVPGEDLFGRMMKAWPRLKTLELRSTFTRSNGAQALRLPHLQVIAKECRNLERLRISIDARQRKSPSFQLETMETNTKNALRELEITCALLEEVSGFGVAVVVRHLWPRLRLGSSERARTEDKAVVITEKFY